MHVRLLSILTYVDLSISTEDCLNKSAVEISGCLARFSVGQSRAFSTEYRQMFASKAGSCRGSIPASHA